MKTMIHQCGFLIGIFCYVALCASDSRQRTRTRTEEADVVRLRGKVENERIEELLKALIEEKEEEEEKEQRDEREEYNFYDDDADAVAPPANEAANDASAGQLFQLCIFFFGNICLKKCIKYCSKEGKTIFLRGTFLYRHPSK